MDKQEDWDNEDFSNEQIRVLLQRAEQRLNSAHPEHTQKTAVGAQMPQKYASASRSSRRC